MPITDKQEVKDLLTTARATRNYCMLTGRRKDASDKLIVALAPFDGAPSRIKVEDLTTLRKAMRDVCQSIDPYTLTRILDGDPPVQIGTRGPKPQTTPNGNAEQGRIAAVWEWMQFFWPKLWQRAVLPGAGIVLLVMAMHYTHWALGANILLTKLDDHLETDFYGEIRDLIVVAAAISEDTGDGLSAPPGSPTQQLFDQTISRLTAYHVEDVHLRASAVETDIKIDVITAASEFVRGLPARINRPRVERVGPNLGIDDTGEGADAPGQTAEAANGDDSLEGHLIDQVRKEVDDAVRASGTIAMAETLAAAAEPQPLPAPPAIVSTGAAGVAKLTPELSDEALVAVGLLQTATSGNETFKEIVKLVSEMTGRSEGDTTSYEEGRRELQNYYSNISGKISIVNRWALPVLYGSLGAALFCLVRVLTPSLSDLGPARTFLRVLFGAFAAMTLSALFIPANVFSINDQSNPTLIFLACFLFGYSFDSVLAALHRLETFLRGRLRTPDEVTD
ncbi:MAG: hypothetical protein AAF566_07175 [Pseudomonadota bacterium]